MNYKLGMYVRISTEEAAQILEGSIASQKHRLQAWVDIKNMQQEGCWGHAVETYSDEGISAKDMNRPAFQRMMRDLRNGKINMILVTELSRLSRSIADFCHIVDELKKYKAGFLSIKEQFDTSTPAGEMMIFNMINLAQFERKQVAERVSLNFHSRAMRGLINGGQAPLGYDKDPAKRCTYIVNEAEAAQIREIFQTYLSSGSLARTAQILKEAGLGPKQKSKRRSADSWNTKNLSLLLRSRVYIGEREVNVKYKKDDQKTLKSFQKFSIAKASWPAIIDPKLFEQVQTQLETATSAERSKRSKGVFNIYWLSGLIRCPDCGRGYLGACAHGRNQVHRYYVHPSSKIEGVNCRYRRIRAEEIESQVEAHLGGILGNNGHFDLIRENIEKAESCKVSDLDLERDGLEKRQTQIEVEVGRLFDLQLKSPDLATELFGDRLAKLSVEKKSNQLRLAELESQTQLGHSAQKATDSLREQIAEFNRGWKKATGAEKKRLSRRVLSRLVPSDEGLNVFYFLDEGFGLVSGGAGVAGSKALAGSQGRKDLILSCAGSDVVENGWGGRG